MKARQVGPFSSSFVSSPEGGLSLLDKLHLGSSCHRFPQSPLLCEEQLMPQPSHAVRLTVSTEHSRQYITRGGHIICVRAWMGMEHGAHV